MLCLATGPASAARAQSSPVTILATGAVPDGVLGRRLTAFLAAYNTGDSLAIRSFVVANYQPAALERRRGPAAVTTYWASVFQEIGPVSFHSLERTARSATHDDIAWLRGDRTGAWIGLIFPLEPEPPYRIVGSGVIRGIRPTHPFAGPRVALDHLADSLHAYFARSTAGGHFSGVALVARQGDILFTRAYGTADDDGRPLTVDSPFRLASVTKMFTGVAIAQLVERGALAFQDPLTRFVPEYPEHISRQVTVHHLLTHQSGIELDDYPEYNDAIVRARSIDEILAIQLRYLPHLNAGNYDTFTPLGRFDYTNEGIDLLGVIVERASGQSWRDYIREHVFEAAGMVHAGTDELDGAPQLVTGYAARDAEGHRFSTRRAVPASRAALLRPAGSGYGTAMDMYRFLEALRTHRLLSPPYTDTVMAAHVDGLRIPGSGITRQYGYTFDVTTRDGVRRVGHSGGAPGISTVVALFPEQGWVVVVLSNFDRAAPHAFAYVEELIAGLDR